MRRKTQRARFGGCRGRERSPTGRSRIDWSGNDSRRNVLSCVVDDCELCLRERIVRSAVVQIHAARDELASTKKFLSVVEDLWFEVTLWRVLVEFRADEVFPLTIGASMPSS